MFEPQSTHIVPRTIVRLLTFTLANFRFRSILWDFPSHLLNLHRQILLLRREAVRLSSFRTTTIMAPTAIWCLLIDRGTRPMGMPFEVLVENDTNHVTGLKERVKEKLSINSASLRAQNVKIHGLKNYFRR